MQESEHKMCQCSKAVEYSMVGLVNMQHLFEWHCYEHEDEESKRILLLHLKVESMVGHIRVKHSSYGATARKTTFEAGDSDITNEVGNTIFKVLFLL